MRRFLKSNILSSNLLCCCLSVVEPSQTRKAGFAGNKRDPITSRVHEHLSVCPSLSSFPSHTASKSKAEVPALQYLYDIVGKDASCSGLLDSSKNNFVFRRSLVCSGNNFRQEGCRNYSQFEKQSGVTVDFVRVSIRSQPGTSTDHHHDELGGKRSRHRTTSQESNGQSAVLGDVNAE